MVNISYCALCQNHPVRALEFAQRLLNSVKNSSVETATTSISAHMYERGICMMNNCAEALTHITKAAEVEENLKSSRVQSLPKRTIKKIRQSRTPLIGVAGEPQPEVYRLALCVNMATVRLQQGELELAEESLKKALSIRPSSKEALNTLLYLRLRQGATEKALQLMQERRPFQ